MVCTLYTHKLLMEETTVMIVGAGPSGLATSACLNHLSIPNIIVEKEDCCGSLWKKRAYDRLHLHLDKDFCSLPFKPHSPSTPTFMPKHTFIDYLDAYVTELDLNPRLRRTVVSATFDGESNKWRVEARNGESGEIEVYVSRFLVVATGENDVGYIPEVGGLEGFGGDVVHSNEYKNGGKYEGKDVLVVGCGNSGMEISYDLYNFKANTSIVIKSPFHVVTRDMVQWGMQSLRFLSVSVVDAVLLYAADNYYGDLSKYGIIRPSSGPFHLKDVAGRSPVIDVGTVDKIKTGEIQVFPGIVRVEGDEVEFENGRKKRFDAIVFATGYKSLNEEWLNMKEERILDRRGMPKKAKPDNYKGEKGVYCAGFSRMGIDGISGDAKAIAHDIHVIITSSRDDHHHQTAQDENDVDVGVNLKWKAVMEGAIEEAAAAGMGCNWKAVAAAIVEAAAANTMTLNCKGDSVNTKVIN